MATWNITFRRVLGQRLAWPSSLCRCIGNLPRRRAWLRTTAQMWSWANLEAPVSWLLRSFNYTTSWGPLSESFQWLEGIAWSSQSASFDTACGPECGHTHSTYTYTHTEDGSKRFNEFFFFFSFLNQEFATRFLTCSYSAWELRTTFTFLNCCGGKKKRICDRDRVWLAKPKIFTIWPFVEKNLPTPGLDVPLFIQGWW